MLDLGAPETDIADYLAEEGVTAADLRAHTRANSGGKRNVTVSFADGSSHVYRNVPSSTTPKQVTARAEREFGLEVVALDGGRGQSHAAPDRSAHETYQVLERLVRQLYPHARITSTKRSAEHNRAVGGVENSYHVSGHGLDVVGLNASERADLRSKMEAAGVQFDEFKFHDAGSGMHLHMAATHVPDDLFGDAEPSDEELPLEGTVTDTGGPYAPEAKAPTSTPSAPTTNAWEAAALGLGDSATFGFLDEAGAVADTLFGGNKKSLWDGSSFSDAYEANVAANREHLEAARNEHPYASAAGGIAGGLIPISRAGKIAMAGSELSTGAKLAKAAKEGAAYGAAYGLGSDEGGITDRLDGAAVGAGAGAALGLGLSGAGVAAGKALAPAGERLFPKIAQRRFEAKQAANKMAAYDRELSSDVSNILASLKEGGVTPRAGKLTKQQQATLVDRVGELETSYLPRSEIKALGLPPSVKSKLDLAMARRNILSESQIADLRDGSVAGEAVADAITKARRLRALVPEVAGRSNSGLGRMFAEALGGTLGAKIGGPIGSMVGASAGRKLSRSEVNSAAEKAVELAAQSERFAKMPQETFGPRGTTDPSVALRKLADEKLDAPYIEKAADARLAEEGRKTAMLNARDDIRPQGGFRGYVYDKTGLLPSQQDAGALVALKDGKISQDQFQAFLEAPDKLMANNAGNHLVDRLAEMTEAGSLKVDPKWTKPEAATSPGAAPLVDAQGQPIRSLPAYQAGAAKNIARDLPLLQELDAINVNADGSRH